MKIMLISPTKPIGGISSWTNNILNSKYKSMFVLVDSGKKCSKNLFVVKLFDLLVTLKIIFYCLFMRKFDIVHINTSCSLLGMLREIIWIMILKLRKKIIFIEYHCDVNIYCNSYFKKSC
ncbi:hypothetical protein B5E87_02720 [Massilimicrobiota sp. An142]|nr:hypothetical protein B5E87_02720 [Massilimicrobiota sp. An142]